MCHVRIASILIATGAVAGFAAPASALISAHLPGSGYYRHGGMTMTPKPAPIRPMHMGGGCCGGGHMSGGHMSGGSYGGGHHVTWGGKPPRGTHPMGMHFYGMGGGLAKKYGMWWGGHAPASWGYHATGGGYGSHVPSGTHMMGMHFYGMSGGSLAAKYGHLQHDYGAMYGTGSKSHGTSYGSQAAYSGSGSGSTTPQHTWGSSAGSSPSQSHKGSFHASYKFSSKVTSKRHVAYSSTTSKKHGGSGTWGAPRPSHWAYGMK